MVDVKKLLKFLFFVVITAAGVVPFGGRKSLPHSSIVQIIFNFWSFEIKKCILRT